MPFISTVVGGVETFLSLMLLMLPPPPASSLLSLQLLIFEEADDDALANGRFLLFAAMNIVSSCGRSLSLYYHQAGDCCQVVFIVGRSLVPSIVRTIVKNGGGKPHFSITGDR